MTKPFSSIAPDSSYVGLYKFMLHACYENTDSSAYSCGEAREILIDVVDPCVGDTFQFTTSSDDWPDSMADSNVIRGYIGMPTLNFSFDKSSIVYSPCTTYPTILADLCPSFDCIPNLSNS